MYVRRKKTTYVPKKKTFQRRKAFRKKKRNYLIPKNPQYTPGAVVRKTMRANLCYSENQMLDSTAGAADVRKYRLNSIFDPNFAVGGHQPMGRDEYATLFQAYRVLGARITAKFYWDQSALVGQAHNCGITFLSPNQTTSITDQTQLIERTHNKCVKTLKSNSRDSQTVTCYWSAKKYFGKILAYDHTSIAAMGADPAYPAIAQVWAGTADRSSNTSESVRVDIVIDYIVEFSEPISLSTS